MDSRLRLRRVRAAAGILFLAGPGLLAGAAPSALALDFNVLWESRLSGGEQEKTQSAFVQRYNLSQGITLEPTHAISAGGNVAYSRYIQDLESGRRMNETFSPAGNIGLSNDLFGAGLAASMTRTRNSSTDGSETVSGVYNWTGSLGSAWTYDWWPRLQYQHTESRSTQDEPASEIRASDDSLNVDWDLKVGKLVYLFSRGHSEDLEAHSENNSTSHLVRFDTGGTFWSNRLRIKLSQSLARTSDEFSALVPDQGVVAVSLDELKTAYATYAAKDPAADPTLPVTDPIVLALRPGLHRNPLDASPPVAAVIVAPEERWHLGVGGGIFDLKGEQLVDRLRVWVIEWSGAETSLSWELYRSFDNEHWTRVSTPVPVYDAVEQRFDVDVGALPRDTRYVKLVVTNRASGAGAPPLNIRWLEPVRLLTGRAGTTVSEVDDRNTATTDLNLSVQLARTLSAVSSLYWTLSGGSQRRDVNGTVTWNPYDWVSSSLGYSESRLEGEDAPTSVDRSYSLMVPVRVLPTLNVTFGATHREVYAGSEQTSADNNYSVTSYAILYPDLTADLAGTYSVGSISDLDGTTEDRESLTSLLSLHARVNRKLQVNVTTNYTKDLAPKPGTNLTSTLDLVYRPSDFVTARLFSTHDWKGKAEDALRFRVDVAAVRTRKTRLNLGYEHLKTETSRDTVDLNGSWDISQFFTLKSHASYTVSDKSAWSIINSLYLKM